jgi:hypothetical protein
MSGLIVAGFMLLIIAILVLLAIGIFSIRSGLKALPGAASLGLEPVWHKQPKVLLGINNIAFAVLLSLVGLLSTAPNPTIKTTLFVMIILTLIISIFLVISSILVSLQAARNLRAKKNN